MKLYARIIILISLIILMAISYFQNKKIYKLTTENSRLSSNLKVLEEDIEEYKTFDDLNAASISSLELKLSEFKKIRSEDQETIKKLNIKNRSLDALVNVQTETIQNISGTFKDSIIFIRDTLHTEIVKTDTLKCLTVLNTWFELVGCEEQDGKFNGLIISKESLTIVETVKHKRFLGFLWKTKKIKDRKVDVLSKNPNTRITDIDYIKIFN